MDNMPPTLYKKGVASLKHAFETVQLQGMPFLSCFRACTARRLLLYRINWGLRLLNPRNILK
uniref:Uncharacterized protein n=1 Tax=Picea glauca TaxID=3330 RepID=A0A117NHC4_PICGL|nr:hypothetical protein ABT39_MTgene5123 [Picea glauca]QHR87757.1 hypothetical protein Q903MT_gene1769 [Picea sitchensis]